MPKHLIPLAIAAAFGLSACNSPQGESVYNFLHMGPHQPLAKARPPERLPRIVRNYNRPNALGISPYLYEQRRFMNEGKYVSDVDMRALADTGDAFAAWTYAERLHERSDPALTMTMLRYYVQAAEAGRAGGVPRVIELMNTEEFEAAPDQQLGRIERLLRRFALDKRDTQAALYLVTRYNLGTPFGDKSEEVVPLLETLADGGDGRIALQLATQILQTRTLSDDPGQRDKARRYLTIAAETENISIQTTAQNLLTLMNRQDGIAPPPAPAPEPAQVAEIPPVAAPANPASEETEL